METFYFSLIDSIEPKTPVGVLQGDASDEDERLAGAVVARYADTPAGEAVLAQVWEEDGASREFEVVPLPPERVRGLKI